MWLPSCRKHQRIGRIPESGPMPTATANLSAHNSATLHRPSPPLSSSRRYAQQVAVIGAGAAGLVAARELRREGHHVVVFERGVAVGGTWIYDPETESDDPLGLNPHRKIVHSSLYKSLRTNLPREVMGFTDYPFTVREGNGRDCRRFPGHEGVAKYLMDFTVDFDLNSLIRFRTDVVRVWREDGWWKLRSRLVSDCSGGGGGDEEEEEYDGVVVCNGHYTEPRIAEIHGMDSWPGKKIHSHNYRVPDTFRDQVVVLIGSSASADDISRDISSVAREVHVSSRSVSEETPKKQEGYANIWQHSTIKSTHEDGTVVFHDGSTVVADVILHCTGYKYHFPFLDLNDMLTVDDNRVGPLYKHVFPPALAPSLSFIGLPWKVVPFPLCELQSKWVAAALSGRVAIPTEKEMMEDVEALYSWLESKGYPKRYTLCMAEYQFEYDDWLAKEFGYPSVEQWRKDMYAANAKNKLVQKLIAMNGTTMT